MVDLEQAKTFIKVYEQYKNIRGAKTGRIALNAVFDGFHLLPTLIEEIESLRKDLAEMYEVTKHVHSR